MFTWKILTDMYWHSTSLDRPPLQGHWGDCPHLARHVRCPESRPTNLTHRTRAIQSQEERRAMSAPKIPATKMFSTKMFSNKLLIATAVLLASAWTMAGAQNASAVKGNGTTVWGKHAAMTVVPEPSRSSAKSFTTKSSSNGTKPNSNDSTLVTIFNNLARRYPNGEFWCCTGYNIMGSASGVGEQWMGAAFTPHANHTVTKISV